MPWVRVPPPPPEHSLHNMGLWDEAQLPLLSLGVLHVLRGCSTPLSRKDTERHPGNFTISNITKEFWRAKAKQQTWCENHIVIASPFESRFD